MRTIRFIRWAAPIAAIVIAVVAFSDEPKKEELGKPAIDPPPVKVAAVAAARTELGKPESAKWSATTYEAATADVNRKVLESGEVKTVTGEVVDVSCYLQLGKRGDAHVPCGTKCIQNGQPIGLVDDDGQLYILFAEEHHPRRDGQVDLKKVFLPLLAKQVTVTGMQTETRGYHALFVPAAEIGATVKPSDTSKKAGTSQKK